MAGRVDASRDLRLGLYAFESGAIDEEQLVSAVHEPLARLSRATAPASASAGGVFECVYLVPVADVEAFRDAVSRVEPASPELTLVCTGPWPPYSFGTSGEDTA